LEKAKTGRIDVYFEGDSITRRWGATDYPQFLANWKQNFFGWNAADFGWGGDTTQNILWRLENGELDNVHPKVIVLLIGINNMGVNTAEEIAYGVSHFVKYLRTKFPKTKVLLLGIFPTKGNDQEKITARPLVK
jgi:hypothetical protein